MSFTEKIFTMPQFFIVPKFGNLPILEEISNKRKIVEETRQLIYNQTRLNKKRPKFIVKLFKLKKQAMKDYTSIKQNTADADEPIILTKSISQAIKTSLALTKKLSSKNFFENLRIGVDKLKVKFLENIKNKKMKNLGIAFVSKVARILKDETRKMKANIKRQQTKRKYELLKLVTKSENRIDSCECSPKIKTKRIKRRGSIASRRDNLEKHNKSRDSIDSWYEQQANKYLKSKVGPKAKIQDASKRINSKLNNTNKSSNSIECQKVTPFQSLTSSMPKVETSTKSLTQIKMFGLNSKIKFPLGGNGAADTIQQIQNSERRSSENQASSLLKNDISQLNTLNSIESQKITSSSKLQLCATSKNLGGNITYTKENEKEIITDQTKKSSRKNNQITPHLSQKAFSQAQLSQASASMSNQKDSNNNVESISIPKTTIETNEKLKQIRHNFETIYAKNESSINQLDKVVKKQSKIIRNYKNSVAFNKLQTETETLCLSNMKPASSFHSVSKRKPSINTQNSEKYVIRGNYKLNSNRLPNSNADLNKLKGKDSPKTRIFNHKDKKDKYFNTESISTKNTFSGYTLTESTLPKSTKANFKVQKSNLDIKASSPKNALSDLNPIANNLRNLSMGEKKALKSLYNSKMDSSSNGWLQKSSNYFSVRNHMFVTNRKSKSLSQASKHMSQPKLNSLSNDSQFLVENYNELNVNLHYLDRRDLAKELYQQELKSHLLQSNQTFSKAHKFLLSLKNEITDSSQHVNFQTQPNKTLTRKISIIENQKENELQNLKKKLLMNSSLKSLHIQIQKKNNEMKKRDKMASKFKARNSEPNLRISSKESSCTNLIAPLVFETKNSRDENNNKHLNRSILNTSSIDSDSEKLKATLVPECIQTKSSTGSINEAKKSLNPTTPTKIKVTKCNTYKFNATHGIGKYLLKMTPMKSGKLKSGKNTPIKKIMITKSINPNINFGAQIFPTDAKAEKDFVMPFNKGCMTLQDHKNKILNRNHDYYYDNMTDFTSSKKIRNYIKSIIEADREADSQRYSKLFKEQKVILTAKAAINDTVYIHSLDDETCFKTRKLLKKRFGVSIDNSDQFAPQDANPKNESLHRICNSEESSSGIKFANYAKILDNNYLLTKQKYNNYMANFNSLKARCSINKIKKPSTETAQ